jgi:hypothetical protein
VPLGPAFARTQAAVRAAGDFDLVRGLLTLTVGGAWERGPVRADSIGPLAPASGAWIAAAGLSARVERARLGFAVRHRIADRSEVGDALRVQRRTGPTDLPAQTGQVSGGTTTFVMGLTIDFP